MRLCGWLAVLSWAALLSAALSACTSPNDEDPTTLEWQGQSYTTFGVAHGDWSSALLTGAVISTLLEERFKLTVTRYKYDASLTVIRHVLGCTDENGDLWDATTHPTEAACSDSSLYQDPPVLAWAGIDVWTSGSSGSKIRELSLKVTYKGKMGYTTTRGLFTHNSSIQAGKEEDLFLSWYEFYTVQTAYEMFTSLSELDRAFRNLTVEIFKEDLCPDGNCHGILTPSCSNDDETMKTYLAILGKDEVCTNGWWLSPACRDDPDTCIPLLIADSNWHFATMAKDVISTGMPMALTWFEQSWKGEQEAVRQLPDERFVFYSWTPDDSMTTVDPQQVVFDERAITNTQVLLPELIMWEGLLDANERVFTFLRLATFGISDIEGMLDKLIDGEAIDDVACDWIQENKAVWKSWIPDLPNATITYLNNENSSTMTAILGAVAGAGGLLLCCVFPCIIWKSLQAITNSPDHEGSTTGQWFVKWAGHQRLSMLREVISSNHAHRSRSRSFLVNATPFHLEVMIPRVWRGELCSGDFTRASGLKRSPREPVTLKVKHFDFPSEFYSVIPREDWRRLQECDALVFDDSDFLEESIEHCPVAKGKKQIKYANRCARKAFPCTGSNEMPLGHLKLVRGPNMSMLILWSPPHILRGVPIRQLESFMNQVIHHEKVWDGCWDIDEYGAAVQSSKPPGSGSRNMYDACQNIVIPEAASHDASYSEIFANHGPPAIFLSHVWGEAALTSKTALEKLRDYVFAKQLARTNMNFRGKLASEEDEDLDEPGHVENALFRVYFCLLCNNQSRLQEERGKNILLAPFTRVLQSNFCSQAALISPLKSLKRKWCNFEFCFARRLKKPVFLLTSEGLVQEGQVPPSMMRDLANAVTTFNCRNATCTNEDDDQFIEAAIEAMGGYDAQNQLLKETFHASIVKAHGLVQRALHTVEGQQDEGPSLDELRLFKTKDGLAGSNDQQDDAPETQDTLGTGGTTTTTTDCPPPLRPIDFPDECVGSASDSDLIRV